MRIPSLAALTLASASIAAPASARPQWKTEVAPRPSAVLLCKKSYAINQTRSETIARLTSLGMVQSVNDVEAQISGMLREDGWSVRGNPSDANASFVLKYTLVYRVPMQFGLDADATGMTTRVRRGIGGHFDVTTPERSMRFAVERHQRTIRSHSEQFSHARKAELAKLTAWHRLHHPWNVAELRELGLRRAGALERELPYAFCDKPAGLVEFQARWQRELGPLGT